MIDVRSYQSAHGRIDPLLLDRAPHNRVDVQVDGPTRYQERQSELCLGMDGSRMERNVLHQGRLVALEHLCDGLALVQIRVVHQDLLHDGLDVCTFISLAPPIYGHTDRLKPFHKASQVVVALSRPLDVVKAHETERGRILGKVLAAQLGKHRIARRHVQLDHCCVHVLNGENVTSCVHRTYALSCPVPRPVAASPPQTRPRRCPRSPAAPGRTLGATPSPAAAGRRQQA